jgi:thioredoxin 1
MPSDDTVTLQDSNFEGQVLQSDTPVLVDFWAVWCGPCRAIEPIVEEVAQEFSGKLKVGKLNIDENQEVAQKYGVRSIPTLLLFKGGRVVDALVGNFPNFKSKLVESIQRATS